MKSPVWRRVGHNQWVVLGTDLALIYCPVNCHFLAFRGGRPLFQVLTLEEATQYLTDRVLCGELES